MASYVLPQVLVFQEFEETTTAQEFPLRACIVGPNYELHRYSNAAEKPDCLVDSSYDPDVETCYAWPDRPAGGEVDESYTAVNFDDALLRYFHHQIGDGHDTTWVSPGKNRIRCTDLVFKTANGSTRSADFYSRDVTVGDVVRLLSSACGHIVTLESTVIGFAAEVVAAVIAAADSDTDNAPTSTAAASGSQTAGELNCVNINTVDGSLYDGLADGKVAETYTVEVIGASTGGDATTGILRVTSTSGTDDVAELTPAAFSAPTAIGTRGLLVTWDNNCSSGSGGASSVDPGVDTDDFVLGQTFVFTVAQDWVQPSPTSGGVYHGETDTTYIVEVSKGGVFADVPQVSVTTSTGVDVSGPTDVTGSLVSFVVGSQGVTLQFAAGITGLCKGDRYTVDVTAEADGAIQTLILANNLPDELRGICEGSSGGSSSSSSLSPHPDLDVKLYMKKDVSIPENRIGYAPLVNWEQSATEICVKDGIIVYDSSWTDSLGVQLPLTVDDGKIYITYRALLTTQCDIVGELSEASSVSETLGTVDPGNPLAFAVYKALLNSNGVEVKYLPLCGTLQADWESAIDILVGRDDVYSLVPLTQSKAILDLFVAHVDSQSTPTNGRWRITWLNMAAEDIKPIYVADGAGDPILATIIDDPDTTGTQYTLVESTGALFITEGVRAGDTVRANYAGDGFGNYTYSSYTVDTVVSEESLKLISGPDAPVNVPSKIEIHRSLTRSELAADLAAKPGLFSDRRAYLVWPDTLGNAGETFPGYHLCAALAGLRSGVLPHQGLTNVEILGFDDVTRTSELFSTAQLNDMAETGYWIVTQDPKDGSIYTRHQLSTDVSTLNSREQSITTNLDNLSFVFLDTMKDFIGKGNVTPIMLQLIKQEISGILATYQNTVTVERLGPQILSGSIIELAVHPTLKDRIVARIRVDLPEPLNNLELHLIVAA